MKLRIFAVILIASSFLIMFTGCWSNQDLASISIATAIGIDKLGTDEIELTLQIVKPTEISTSQSGSSSGDSKAYITVSNKGRTIFEAAREMLNHVNKHVLYSNVQVIIFGEGLARQGIGDSLDFFVRQHELQPQSYVVVAKGSSAREILEISSDMGQVPSLILKDILDNERIKTTIKRTLLIDLLRDLGKKGRVTVIGTVWQEGEKDFHVEGSAVFKADKLIGWLDSMQTRGYRLATSTLRNAVITFRNALDPQKYVSIEVLYSEGHIDIKWENGKPLFIIHVKQDGSVAEWEGSGKLADVTVLKELQEEYARQIESIIRSAVTISQEIYKVDMFSFENVAFKYYHSYWEKEKDTWKNEFMKIPVKIEVEAYIRKIGLVKQSAVFIEKE